MRKFLKAAGAVALCVALAAPAEAGPLRRVAGLFGGGCAGARVGASGKSALGRTRFFDGDGRPLRRAR